MHLAKLLTLPPQILKAMHSGLWWKSWHPKQKNSSIYVVMVTWRYKSISYRPVIKQLSGIYCYCSSQIILYESYTMSHMIWYWEFPTSRFFQLHFPTTSIIYPLSIAMIIILFALDWFWPGHFEMGRWWYLSLQYWHRPSWWIGVHRRNTTDATVGLISWDKKSRQTSQRSRLVFRV